MTSTAEVPVPNDDRHSRRLTLRAWEYATGLRKFSEINTHVVCQKNNNRKTEGIVIERSYRQWSRKCSEDTLTSVCQENKNRKTEKEIVIDVGPF